MSVYLCKWTNDGKKYTHFDEFKVMYLGDFTKDEGYTDRNQVMIEKLNIGDRLDLSDGISQYHEIERLA